MSNMIILYSHKILIQMQFQRAKLFKGNKHVERMCFQQSRLSYNNIVTQTSCLTNSVKNLMVLRKE